MNGTNTEIDTLWNELQSAGLTQLSGSEQAYQQVRLMIFDSAHCIHERFGIPLDDCISVAHVGFMAAYENYGEQHRTAFSSYAHIRIRGHLLDYVRQVKGRKVPRPTFEELNEETAGYSPEVKTPSLEIMDELSSDAQIIMQLLLDTPREIIGWGDIKAPKRLLAAVKTYMVDKGWSRNTVNQAVQEIKTKLQEVWAV